MRKTFKKIGGVLVSLAPLSSFAAADTSAVTAAGTDVAAIGAAVFAVMVGIAVWKWSRRAL